MLLDHFNPPDEAIIPYSDKAFESAAIEWLVQTNQVRDLNPPSLISFTDLMFASADSDVW